MELVGAPDGTLAAVRNVWRMDELFSSSVLVDFDKNANGKLDEEELEAVGETIRASIAGHAYYTSVETGGRPVKLAAPDAIRALYQDGQLLLFFEMKAGERLDLKTQPLTVANFDDSFYVAFNYSAKSFGLVDMPASCKETFIVPDEDAAARQWVKAMAALGPNQDAPADGVNFSAILAARMEVKCG